MGMANSKHFSEYIGAQDVGVTFADVPINPNVEFHFILAFAVDYTRETSPPSPNNGQFDIFWDQVNLSPTHVKSIKKAHPNVKVALSLGGNSVEGEENLVYFRPESVESWVTHAVSSLREILEVKYEKHLDGIDINYEHFEKKASPAKFAACIGQLITTLKDEKLISFASIAPFDVPTVQKYYKALWESYAHVIDYVNFQFYACPKINVDQFMERFNRQSAKYHGGKVLASFQIGEDEKGLSPNHGFFTACDRLKAENKLHGIFIWSADSSHRSKNFRFEEESQKMLLE